MLAAVRDLNAVNNGSDLGHPRHAYIHLFYLWIDATVNQVWHLTSAPFFGAALVSLLSPGASGRRR
jgi:hypothetical protein